jgi:hypothetical protein
MSERYEKRLARAAALLEMIDWLAEAPMRVTSIGLDSRDFPVLKHWAESCGRLEYDVYGEPVVISRSGQPIYLTLKLGGVRLPEFIEAKAYRDNREKYWAERRQASNASR